jgi:hypothetical protein
MHAVSDDTKVLNIRRRTSSTQAQEQVHPRLSDASFMNPNMDETCSSPLKVCCAHAMTNPSPVWYGIYLWSHDESAPK